MSREDNEENSVWIMVAIALALFGATCLYLMLDLAWSILKAITSLL